VAYRNGGGRTLDIDRGETRSHESPLVRSLAWRKVGNCWQLFAGKRRFGKVIPDSKHPGMWRAPLSGGRLSDMANLSWARNAVMEAAIREIEWEARQAANTPSNSQQSAAVFRGASSPIDLNGSGHPDSHPPNRGFPPGRLLGGNRFKTGSTASRSRSSRPRALRVNRARIRRSSTRSKIRPPAKS
jgi:hypothetical protein